MYKLNRSDTNFCPFSDKNCVIVESSQSLNKFSVKPVISETGESNAVNQE